jgi:hypothetical protein
MSEYNLSNNSKMDVEAKLKHFRDSVALETRLIVVLQEKKYVPRRSSTVFKVARA